MKGTQDRIYVDREEAGRLLGEALLGEARLGRVGADAIVLALPRGGVEVAAGVARALGGSLDVFLARKIGAPMQPELGMGAIAEDGTVVLDDAIVALVGATREQVARITARERVELERRVALYRGGRPPPDVQGRTVVLVDDGVATGGTARAALRAIRRQGPARLLFAVPVGAGDTIASLKADADEVVCLQTPRWFHAIGECYQDFSQVDDGRVLGCLAQARSSGPDAGGRDVVFRVDGIDLPGRVEMPVGAHGLVVFVHGSGASRRSPRNRAVALAFQRAGYGTVLFDLLTPSESVSDSVTGRLRFDIPLLTGRLLGVVDDLGRREDLAKLPLALFGASTGAAAALAVAEARARTVRVVVSRGGRPDLARDALPGVKAPVLLIVGGRDPAVIELNREALRRLTAPASLAIVPGATHLFEEAHALDEVVRLAVGFLDRNLALEHA